MFRPVSFLLCLAGRTPRSAANSKSSKTVPLNPSGSVTCLPRRPVGGNQKQNGET